MFITLAMITTNYQLFWFYGNDDLTKGILAINKQPKKSTTIQIIKKNKKNNIDNIIYII